MTEQAYSITLVPPATCTEEAYDAIVYATNEQDVLERVLDVMHRDNDTAPGIWWGWCLRVNGRINTMVPAAS